MKNSFSNFEQRLFFSVLALLVWLPLPLASNRPWAEAFFEIAITLIALAWLLGWKRGEVVQGVAFSAARPLLLVLGIWLIYLAFTIISLPHSLRALLSPESVVQYQMVGIDGWTSLSVDPYSGFMYWMRSVAYALLFVLTLLLVNSKQRLVLLAYTLVLSGLFQAFYGSIMTLSGMEYGFFVKKEYYVGFATGTFVNRNHLAGYLEMTLAIGIGLLLSSWTSGEPIRTWQQRVRSWVKLLLSAKLLLRLMLAIMVIALVLSRSRMGNTAFFSGMLVAGFLTLVMIRAQTGSVREMFSNQGTRSIVILLSSLMVIDLFIVGAWFGVEKVVARIEQTTKSYDSDRIEMTKFTIKLWQDYPLVGSGGGSLHSVYPRYRQVNVRENYDHTHQDYLEIAADTGIIGLGLLGTMVLMSLVGALIALKRRHDPLMRGMAFASTMGIIALLIHSTVDFNLQIPANAATFMVILALGWIALSLDRKHVNSKIPG